MYQAQPGGHGQGPPQHEEDQVVFPDDQPPGQPDGGGGDEGQAYDQGQDLTNSIETEESGLRQSRVKGRGGGGGGDGYGGGFLETGGGYGGASGAGGVYGYKVGSNAELLQQLTDGFGLGSDQLQLNGGGQVNEQFNGGGGGGGQQLSGLTLSDLLMGQNLKQFRRHDFKASSSRKRFDL